MTHRLYLLLLLLLSLAARAQDSDTPYYNAVGLADKAAADGKWKEAITHLERAMKEEPDNPGNILLLSNIGMMQYNLGADSLAIESLNEAHEAAPRSVTILSNRAKVLASMGRNAEAAADYASILALDSLDTHARLNHTLLSLRCRRYKDARTDAEWLQKNAPSTDEADIAGGALYCALGEYDKALPLYNSLLSRHKEPEYLSARALCNLMTGNLQEASDDISEALGMTPDDGELYLYRAALNRMRYRPEDARKDALRAVELGVEQRRAEQFLK